MIVLKFPKEVSDASAKTIIQAAKILFNSTRPGFKVTWADHQTLEIRQSETMVSVKRDPKHSLEEEGGE
jgi:hypothetical protein